MTDYDTLQDKTRGQNAEQPGDNTLLAKVEARIAEETEHLRDRIDELEAETSQLRDQLETERQARREAEAERDDLREEVEDLREQLDMVQQDLWNIEDAAFGEVSSGMAATWAEEDGALLERVETLEETETTSGGRTYDTIADDDPSEMLPIEKLAALPDDVARQQLDNSQNRNLYRARYVWMNWEELSTATGSGDNRGSRLTSRDVKLALNTWDEEDANVESKTVKRVFDRIEEWTYWITETRRTDSERRLWRPADWKDRRAAARDQAELDGHHLADAAVSGGR